MSDLHEYGDSQISSYDNKIPRWLFWTYIILPIWGVIWFLLYWNGIQGWLDPGSWNALEQAANTTFPKIIQESSE